MSAPPRAHYRRSQEGPAVHSAETEAKRHPPEDSRVRTVTAEANRHYLEGTCEMKICVQLRSNLDAIWMHTVLLLSNLELWSIIIVSSSFLGKLCFNALFHSQSKWQCRESAQIFEHSNLIAL